MTPSPRKTRNRALAYSVNRVDATVKKVVSNIIREIPSLFAGKTNRQVRARLTAFIYRLQQAGIQYRDADEYLLSRCNQLATEIGGIFQCIEGDDKDAFDADGAIERDIDDVVDALRELVGDVDEAPAARDHDPDPIAPDLFD